MHMPASPGRQACAGKSAGSARAVSGQVVGVQVCVNLLNGFTQFPADTPNKEPPDALYAVSRDENAVGCCMNQFRQQPVPERELPTVSDLLSLLRDIQVL